MLHRNELKRMASNYKTILRRGSFGEVYHCEQSFHWLSMSCNLYYFWRKRKSFCVSLYWKGVWYNPPRRQVTKQVQEHFLSTTFVLLLHGDNALGLFAYLQHFLMTRDTITLPKLSHSMTLTHQGPERLRKWYWIMCIQDVCRCKLLNQGARTMFVPLRPAQCLRIHLPRGLLRHLRWALADSTWLTPPRRSAPPRCQRLLTFPPAPIPPAARHTAPDP